MTTIPFVSWPDDGWLGCWDHGVIADLIAGRFGQPAGWADIIQTHHNIDRDAPLYGHGVAVVHVSGRFHHDKIDELNTYLAPLAGVLLIVTSDEEHLFPIENVEHRNMLIWRQLPRIDDPSFSLLDRGFGEGAPADTFRPRVGGPRDLAWSFAGQITHPRRDHWMRKMSNRITSDITERAVLVASKAFTDGVARAEYLLLLQRSQVVICPAGPVSQSSFRVFEALEAGAVPVVDAVRPDGGGAGYWDAIFHDPPPFPVMDSPGMERVDEVTGRGVWGRLAVDAWWQRERRWLAVDLVDALRRLGAPVPAGCLRDRLTALVTVSPINPDRQRRILGETLASLPDGIEVVVAFDGVRAEDEALRGAYERTVETILDEIRDVDHVVPYIPDGWSHQAGLATEALRSVVTPCVLFVEHDTPICGDVPWEALCDVVEGTPVDVVRLHHEDVIPVEHGYLMDGMVHHAGMPLRMTRQWSQRPHVATTGWYRGMLATHFGPDDRTMIEDAIYGWVEAGNVQVGIFHPDGGIRRSTHTDGRGDRIKHPMLRNGEWYDG